MNIKKFLDHLNELSLSDEDTVETIINVAAGVIYKIDENGTKKFLLIQRAKDDHWPLHWEFPRGKCDNGKNENVRKCALREIKEETGLDVEIEDYIGSFEYLADNGKRRSICYNYLCRMKNPDQKVVFKKTPGGVIEHESYKWITQIGEAELLVLPDQKKILEKVLSNDNSISSTPENDFTKNNKIDE